jgi:hypothetical protein
MEKAREALDKKRNADSEHDQLREASMAREIHPEVFERVSRVVRSAAEGVQQKVLVVRFASAYCMIADERSTTQSRTGRDQNVASRKGRRLLAAPAQIPACAANAPDSHLGA